MQQTVEPAASGRHTVGGENLGRLVGIGRVPCRGQSLWRVDAGGPQSRAPAGSTPALAAGARQGDVMDRPMPEREQVLGGLAGGALVGKIGAWQCDRPG